MFSAKKPLNSAHFIYVCTKTNHLSPITRSSEAFFFCSACSRCRKNRCQSSQPYYIEHFIYKSILIYFKNSIALRALMAFRLIRSRYIKFYWTSLIPIPNLTLSLEKNVEAISFKIVWKVTNLKKKTFSMPKTMSAKVNLLFFLHFATTSAIEKLDEF